MEHGVRDKLLPRTYPERAQKISKKFSSVYAKDLIYLTYKKETGINGKKAS